ncbi:MAG: hypothetical protein C5B57_06765 [Blastocatellia bacterium]|nr:MAG: hypothetical protein C5B57_06765 [Blastocatellia bacterium]
MSSIMRRRVWRAVLLLGSLPTSAQAADPMRPLSQYAHTAWRVQDGSLGGPPTAIAQTADGYLWIGTSTGLVRFDGVRFVPWTSRGTVPLMSSTSVYSLLGGRDGSLWIGTGSSLARLKDGQLFSYTTGLGRINAVVEDDHGSVWTVRSRIRDDSGPLCQVSGAELRCHGRSDGITPRSATALVAAPDRTLWFGNSSALVRWREGSSSVYLPPQLQATENLSGIAALALGSDDAVWVGIIRSGPGLGLQRMQRGVFEPVAEDGFDGTGVAVTALFMDREKAMWIGTEGRGIYRLVDGRIDRFQVADGLSGDSVTAFYQDREGNVWVATSEGIDCFRKTAMVSFSVREGLTANQAASVLADRTGTIWVANEGALDSIRGGHVSAVQKRQGLPGGAVTALLEDHADRLWVGVDNRLSVFERGTFRLINRDDGAPLGAIRAITEDREHNVWVIALGNPQRLIRITDFSVREDMPAPQVSDATSLAADREKGIWMGLGSGHLARYRDGNLETFRFTDGNAVRQVVVTSDGTVFGTTGRGIIAWRNGTLRTLTGQNGLPCDSVHAAIFDTRRALWLYAQCGLIRVGAADLERWWEHADAVVEARVFDALDGVRPGLASFAPKASRSPDGRLWFANDSVVQMLDPAHLVENTLPPPVHIEQVIADRRSYPAFGGVRLPPRTRDLEIDFVGLSYVAPQKVVFRYQLEGRDNGWQEAGTRRQAFYNDLRPGMYRFRVIARNNDGLWNEDGAALDVVVAPAWYQTSWFLALCAVSVIVTVWMIYQVRMRQVARVLNARFDERLAERTRVARDLHDTLLQTVQGSKMVADTALAQPDDPAGMRRAMEQVSMWLGQSSTEGRAAVNALRGSTVETNDLAEAFRRALEDCGRQGSLHASLSVTGEPREMHPVVRDEVYRIGYEAIRNACAHSGGSRLEIGLAYTRDLAVRVADDGVGIVPTVASEGKDGHFGLRGMRERAARIGGKLTIVSSLNSGTEIRLIVPGRVIFRKQTPTLADRLRSHFTN